MWINVNQWHGDFSDNHGWQNNSNCTTSTFKRDTAVLGLICDQLANDKIQKKHHPTSLNLTKDQTFEWDKLDDTHISSRFGIPENEIPQHVYVIFFWSMKSLKNHLLW